jgi:hypothetical protein
VTALPLALQSESIQELLNEAKDALVRRRQQIQNGFHLYQLAGLADKVVTLGSMVGAGAADLHSTTRLKGQCIAGQLALGATNPGYDVEVPLGDERVTMVASSPNATENVSAWLDGYYAAVVARDLETMHLLSSIHVDALREAADYDPEDEPPNFAYALRVALLDMGPTFTGKVHPLPAPADTANSAGFRSTSSLFGAVNAISERSDERLAQELTYAIGVHHDEWQRAQEEDMQGCIAWGPLALACLAFDAGSRLDADTEHLPLALLNPPTTLPVPTVRLPWEAYSALSCFEDLSLCMACWWPQYGDGDVCKKCGEPRGEFSMETSRMSYLIQPQKRCSTCGALCPKLAIACSECGALHDE